MTPTGSDGVCADLARRISEALAFRLSGSLPAGTDAFRVVDGAADGIPGVEIDAFAGRWLVQTRAAVWVPGLERALPEGVQSLHWKMLGAQKSVPKPVWGTAAGSPFEVRESGMRFWVDFAAGYSQGLFLDQRGNRARLREMARDARVLNTFAYTCAFGVAAALGGAATVNLDLSRQTLDWGRRNYRLNGLDDGDHDFLHGDAFEWMRRLAKRGRRFDVIVLDPPTFSRDRKGKVFRVEKDYPELLELALGLLGGRGVVLACTNCRALSERAFEGLLRKGLGGRHAGLEFAEMPPDFRGDPYLKSCWITVAR